MVDLAVVAQDLQAAQTVVLALQVKGIMAGHLTMTMAVAVAVQVLWAALAVEAALLEMVVLVLLRL
jgi:hypothetical protein